MSLKIGPSILNADLSDLANECSILLDGGADYLHLDVMDGHFVPNLTFGHPVVKCLRKKIPGTFFDIHMMVTSPEKWIKPMADSGATQFTFHYEASDDVKACIRKVREAGMKVGLAIKPDTSVQVLVDHALDIDMALIMTVEPGFGGQKFMSNMMSKVKILREHYHNLDIEVDGGVGPETIAECAQAGANMIVSGTALVKSDNPAKTMKIMRQAYSEALNGAQQN